MYVSRLEIPIPLCIKSLSELKNNPCLGPDCIIRVPLGVRASKLFISLKKLSALACKKPEAKTESSAFEGGLSPSLIQVENV